MIYKTSCIVSDGQQVSFKFEKDPWRGMKLFYINVYDLDKQIEGFPNPYFIRCEPDSQSILPMYKQELFDYIGNSLINDISVFLHAQGETIFRKQGC